MLHLILIVMACIQLMSFMLNDVKNFNCFIISPTRKVRMLVLFGCMNRQLLIMNLSLSMLFLLLKLLKIYCCLLMFMIILLFLMQLKNFFLKKIINRLKKIFFPIVVMKHMIFMGYFKENKKITTL